MLTTWGVNAYPVCEFTNKGGSKNDRKVMIWTLYQFISTGDLIPRELQVQPYLSELTFKTPES